MTSRAPFAWRHVLPVAALELVVQVAFANRYGYHRDELYFRVAARNPAFGYDDQPPLTPLLGRLSEAVFGETPRGLRVVSALTVAAVVVVVALLARELGARSTGQLVAAACTAVSGVVVVVGHLLSTSTFDLLAWCVLVLTVARLLGGGDERLWLAAGAITGVCLQNKHVVLLLVLALLMCLALDRKLVPILRSRWLWVGAALAVAIWLPNLVWQAAHGWPQLELASDIRADEGAESRTSLLPLQILLVGPLLAPVWIGGLWALFRDPALRPWRALGLAYPALLVLVFGLAGKPYYTAPVLVCLLAPGAVVAERWLRSTLRGALLASAIVVTAGFSAVLGLPVIPVDRLHGTFVADVNDDAVETVGWPALARAVAQAEAAIPPRRRAGAVVFTINYGEAGAIARYGPALGLPRAYSGHNAYARFGVPPGSTGPVIVLGFRDPDAAFRGCRLGGTIDNGYRVENEEQGGAIFVCAGPREPWQALWPVLRHLDA